MINQRQKENYGLDSLTQRFCIKYLPQLQKQRKPHPTRGSREATLKKPAEAYDG